MWVKTDLISSDRPVAQCSRLCNRAEEYHHARSNQRDLRAKAGALEQWKADRGEAASATKTRLVHSDKASDRGRTRDLAMFNLAIDSKLRGCDVVAIRSRMSPQVDIRQIEQRSGKRKQGDLSDLT